MILDPQHKTAFEQYEKPLQRLERTFTGAGYHIEFFAFEAPLGNKMVEILRKGKRQNVICIEGDSPAQAVKDVVAAVRL